MSFAISAWNSMDGRIDWGGLDLIVETLGVDDVELLLDHLQLIQDHRRE